MALSVKFLFLFLPVALEHRIQEEAKRTYEEKVADNAHQHGREVDTDDAQAARNGPENAKVRHFQGHTP